MTRTGWAEDLAPCAGQRGYAASAPGVDHRVNRADDPDISGAAAQISAHSNADAAFIGRRQPQHEIACGDQHAGRAIAALQGVLARKGGAEFDDDLVIIETFDGDDL